MVGPSQATQRSLQSCRMPWVSWRAQPQRRCLPHLPQRVRRRLPPPPLTGVALSNLYLVGAGLCLAGGQPGAAGLVVALFALSKRLMRIFPPS